MLREKGGRGDSLLCAHTNGAALMHQTCCIPLRETQDSSCLRVHSPCIHLSFPFHGPAFQAALSAAMSDFYRTRFLSYQISSMSDSCYITFSSYQISAISDFCHVRFLPYQIFIITDLYHSQTSAVSDFYHIRFVP